MSLDGRGPLSVHLAERRLHRLLGLAGLAPVPSATGLLIPRCRSVHTLGMRFALDILFVTLERGSLEVHDERMGVPPLRLVRAGRAARSRPGLAALELPAAR